MHKEVASATCAVIRQEAAGPAALVAVGAAGVKVCELFIHAIGCAAVARSGEGEPELAGLAVRGSARTRLAFWVALPTACSRYEQPFAAWKTLVARMQV